MSTIERTRNYPTIRRLFQHKPSIAEVCDALIVGMGGSSMRARNERDISQWRGSSATEILRDAARAYNQPIANDRDMVRVAVGSGSLAASFDSAVGALLLDGFRDQVDTTNGWVEVLNLPNYKLAPIFSLSEAASLQNTPRGDSSEAAALNAESLGNWRLSRYTRSIIVDEMDTTDADSTLDAIGRAMKQFGRAAGRVRPDLVYAVLLANAALSDGSALFAGGRGNYATAVLAGSSLGDAMAAIGNQTSTGADGETCHENREPRYLIVPPDLSASAASALLLMYGTNPPIKVVAESRIGSGGLVDPLSEETFTGSTTNWFLLSDAPRPIAIAYLDGDPTPAIRSTELSGGQFGRQWDVELSVAAKAVDPKSAYFSTGVGG